MSIKPVGDEIGLLYVNKSNQEKHICISASSTHVSREKGFFMYVNNNMIDLILLEEDTLWTTVRNH